MATALLEYPDLMAEYNSRRLKLRYWPNPVLSQIAEPISGRDWDTDLPDVAEQMIALMKRLDGLGLAAPQVGLLGRLFVMLTAKEPLVVCNPHILHQSEEGAFAREGCLSLPGVYGDVWRPSEIHMSYQDAQGHPHEIALRDMEARVALHEIDHLNGVMFFNQERMTRRERKAVESDWRRFGVGNIAKSQLVA